MGHAPDTLSTDSVESIITDGLYPIVVMSNEEERITMDSDDLTEVNNALHAENVALNGILLGGPRRFTQEGHIFAKADLLTYTRGVFPHSNFNVDDPTTWDIVIQDTRITYLRVDDESHIRTLEEAVKLGFWGVTLIGMEYTLHGVREISVEQLGISALRPYERDILTDLEWPPADSLPNDPPPSL
jgi:hypothetical protein